MCTNCNDKKTVHGMDIKTGIYTFQPCPLCKSKINKERGIERLIRKYEERYGKKYVCG